MAWSQADLDAIDTAIRNAIQGKAVTFGGRSWTSQDLGELRSLRAEIVIDVEGASGTRQGYRLAATRKGV
jgi:hypothetical protein